ncbi:MAG: hypothetical protein ACE5G0_04270 [Rhodothermales bacterium]
MPVMSYIAYLIEGQKTKLFTVLEALPDCDVIPSTNRDVLILVTDTKDKQAEHALRETLEAIPSLQCLAMVAGYADPKAQQEE